MTEPKFKTDFEFEEGRMGIAPQQLGRLIGYESPTAMVQTLYRNMKRKAVWDGEVKTDSRGRLKWLSIPAAIRICQASHMERADDVARWLTHLPR